MEAQNVTSETPAAADAAKKPTKAKKILITMVTVVALAAAAYVILNRGKESTDDAFVEGHVVNVAARTAGQVTKVLVQDNQPVNAGDPLVELDTVELEARLAAAAADLAAAKAQFVMTQQNADATIRTAKGALTQATSGLSGSEAALIQARADVAQARSRYSLADIDLRRIQKLTKDGVVSASELDAKQSAFDQAKAQLDQANARFKSAETGITGSAGGIEQAEGRLASANTAPVQVQAAQAKVDQAEAAHRLAELNLSYAVVKAPVKGVISRRSVEPGQVVAPGTPLLAVVPLDDVWVVANFKEDQIAEISAGQAATVTIDSFGRHELHGHVDSLAGATGSKFALLPPDNASGNFVKVVQRLPVLVRLDGLDKSGVVLRPGMSAVVIINTAAKPAQKQ